MEICYAPPLFWCIVRMYQFIIYLIIFINPLVFSTLELSNNPRPHHLSNASDQKALLGFRSAITYDPSQSLSTNWKQNVSFCQWTGIICSGRRQRVVSLHVLDMGLEGTISPLLGNLSFLRILDLRNNSFHGHIPYQLGNLFRLKMLLLSRNQLQGSIPHTLDGCRSLRRLTMFANNLTGIIPSELCILPKLQYFSLAMNNLTGTVPTCMGNISSLYSIDFGSNNLQGSVPSELGMLSQVMNITLHFNHLTGQIPSSLSNCTNLLELNINENQLTGHIPAELCSKNTRLTALYLFANQLTGSIPASLFNCTKFEIIEFGFNQLSGVVPLEFGKLTQLQVLSLDNNRLVSGSSTSLPIFTALTNCSTLHKIVLENNYLRGRLSFSIGRLSKKMDYIDLGFNDLAGEIPPQIGNLTNLTLLALGSNSFTGEIPSSLNMLHKLERLFMGPNNFQGNIPTEIWQLKSLGLLALWGNNLSGSIPDFTVGLQQLWYMDISLNQLSGNIPANLGKCVNLLWLDLSYNRLSGHIPSEVAGIENLAVVFNLSNNLLHGPVPVELSKMTMLQALDISANRLTGHIPSALGRCIGLDYLNLSCNALEGLIPVSIGELQNIQDMDFSSNNFSGRLPTSLENLKMLGHLNFSFNNLSGEVPKGGVFKKLGATAFMGNLGLCGPWVGLSPCSSHKHKSVSHLKRVIIPVVAAAVTVVSCLFMGILWIQNHKRRILKETMASLIVEYQRISYEEIITATEEFSDTNLLGVGSFGTVYRGVLNDGTNVAIKLLSLENEGAHKSFDKECKVLSRVKHRNLIRIITTYSDLQIKALIFPLMPNESLEKWLYPDGEAESDLSLIQRLNIAIDIAHGVMYLHHYCFVQVIHCDLKPNNVLLGEDMTEYLTDFGIATLCFEKFGDLALTSTHALKGSAGYIPPEYALGGHVTTKGDVYSYGIVLLEMLTGKKPTHNMFVEGLTLQKWVGSSFPNRIGEVVDKSLLRTSTSVEKDKDLHCLSQFATVGLLCTKESSVERPTMKDIVRILQSIKETFLGTVGIPKFQSDITHLLGSTSTNNNNNIGESQTSSTL